MNIRIPHIYIIFSALLIAIVPSCQKINEPQKVAVASIQLSLTSLEIVEGNTQVLVAHVLPDNATNKNIVWSSSDESIATVYNGVVTALSKGTAVIIASSEDGGKTAVANVCVTPKPISVSSISLDKSELALEVGENYQLTATVSPSDATNKAVNWQSLDTKVATVDSDGCVYALSAGSTTVIASTEDGGKIATVSIEVRRTIPITQITLNETAINVDIGESLTLKAFITPADATDRELLWSSKDESVATVDDGVVMGVSAGETSVTASTKDGSVAATCTVTVMKRSYTVFTNAGAYYYGSRKDVNVFCTYLLTGQTRVDEGVISGIGTALYIGINGTINADNTIPAGKYGPAGNDEETGTFLKGKWIDDETISGTYIYYRSLNGSAEYRLVKNGEISFNFSGTTSSTKARIQATVVDEYGVEFTFDYEGWFSYDDMVEPDPGTDPDPDPEVEPVDYVLKDFIKGYIYDYGQDFGTDAVSDYRIWRICLADANFNLDDLSGSGQELQMEIITEADATDITGTFSVKYQDWPSTWSDALTKDSAFWGYIDNNNYVGTWFFPGTDEEKWTGATSGSVTITKGSSIYTITFDFADKFLQTTFKGTYKGGLTKKNLSFGTSMKVSRKALNKQPAIKRSMITPFDRLSITRVNLQ